ADAPKERSLRAGPRPRRVAPAKPHPHRRLGGVSKPVDPVADQRPELEEDGVGRELRRRVEPCGQRRQRAKGNDEENRADQEISLYPEQTHPRQLASPPDPRGVKAGSHLGPDGGSQSDAAGPLGREAGPSSPPYTERRQAPPSRNEQEITG